VARDSRIKLEGELARLGLFTEAGLDAANAALERIEAEGIETVRVVFADQHGILRGKTIVADAFSSAIRNGIAVTSTLLLKDTAHRTVFPIWSDDIGFGRGTLTGGSDILMAPDPTSFRVLPWSRHSGWVLCDLYQKDGTPIAFSSRGILREAVKRLSARGMTFVCGLEVEFYVFRIKDPHLEHADGGIPCTPPETSLLAHGYQYLTEARYDALEEVIDDLRRACQEIGLPIRSTEAEFGPSQCEFTFEPDGALQHADAMVLFRSLVKQVCARKGLHATFMCRPKVDFGMASGWHLHQSVVDGKTGDNLFMPEADGRLSETASRWIAGLLDHAAETCLLTTPTVNGYKRYQAFQLAPDRIQWGRDNRGAMIRGLMTPGDKASRVENRVAEPAANPYFYFASQILSGLDGIERRLEAPAPVENPYASDAVRLPTSLIGAIERFEASAFYEKALGAEFVSYLAHIKRSEWDRYLTTISEWEQREYFSLF
jgi:glutamine synthetase